MDWLQDNSVDLEYDLLKKSCPCFGAVCRGRCMPYGVCVMHLGDRCKQLVICGVHIS